MDFSVGSWLSPNGSTVARLNGPAVELTDSRTGDVERVVRTGLGSNGDVSFSDDGFRYAVNGDGTTVVFDQTQGGELGQAVKLCHPIFARSGRVEIAGGTVSVLADCERKAQYLLDAETLEVREIEAESGARSALSPDGRYVASQTGRVVTHNGRGGVSSAHRSPRCADGEIVRTMYGLCEWVDGGEWGPDSEWGRSCVPFPDTPFPDWPWDLVFSPDGSMLAMSGQNTPAVVVWDTSSGEIIATPTVSHQIDPEWVHNAAFSPDGDRLVASLGLELWMFSTEDWGEVSQYLGQATGEVPVDNLTFTPDGETLIGTPFSHFGAGDIVFMDGATLEHLDQIAGAHPGGVNDIALNQDGTCLPRPGSTGLFECGMSPPGRCCIRSRCHWAVTSAWAGPPSWATTTSVGHRPGNR